VRLSAVQDPQFEGRRDPNQSRELKRVSLGDALKQMSMKSGARRKPHELKVQQKLKKNS